MPNIGPLEIAIVLIIVLVVFGPKKIPGLGKSVGQGLREFRASVTGRNDEQIKEPTAVTEVSSNPRDKRA